MLDLVFVAVSSHSVSVDFPSDCVDALRPQCSPRGVGSTTLERDLTEHSKSDPPMVLTHARVWGQKNPPTRVRETLKNGFERPMLLLEQADRPRSASWGEAGTWPTCSSFQNSASPAGH